MPIIPNPDNISENQHPLLEDENQRSLLEDSENLTPSSQSSKLSRFKFISILFSLLLILASAAFDQTLIVTLLVPIASEFNELSKISIFSIAYLSTSFIVEKQAVRLCYTFGHKITILASVLLFLIGIILASLSVNLTMLIVARAIAGFGGGGLLLLCILVIKEIVPENRFELYTKVAVGIFTLISILGSMLNNVFLDRLTWRWCFYVTMPPMGIGCILLIFLLPNKFDMKSDIKIEKFDYIGSITLFSFIALLALSLNWTAEVYPWNSVAVILTLVLSLLLLVGFIYSQFKLPNPMIHHNLMSRNVICCCIIIFFSGAVFFTSIIYILYYFQMIYTSSSQDSVTGILPMIGGIVGAFFLFGPIVNKTGIYRFLLRFSSLLGILGASLLVCFISLTIKNIQLYSSLALIGLSVGGCLKISNIASQVSVIGINPQAIGSLIRFFFSFGGIIGITVCGTVYHNVLINLLSNYSSKIDVTSLINNTTYILSLSPELRLVVHNCHVEALKAIFYSFITFFSIGFIFSLFVEHIPLPKNV